MTNVLKHGEELPVIKAKVRVYNPDYIPGQGNQAPGVNDFMFEREREVEVLTLNLNTGTMRVRFTDVYDGKKKVMTVDISNLAFFQQYSIVKA